MESIYLLLINTFRNYAAPDQPFSPAMSAPRENTGNHKMLWLSYPANPHAIHSFPTVYDRRKCL